jgi:hypothetical protein
MIDSFNRVTKVDYATELNARQKEQHLFQKCSAVLADYGYATIKLSDDWQGADFIAISQISGEFFKIQLKGRFTVAKKYESKDLYIVCPINLSLGQWCIYPHDELVGLLRKANKYLDSDSWINGGAFSVGKVKDGHWLLELLKKYMIG